MTRDELIEQMRDDYRQKDLISLKRHYLMGNWLLRLDDKDKIEMAISKLEKEGLPDIVVQALKMLGGKIVS